MVIDVKFADDQGVVASTGSGLQRKMNKLNDTVKNFDMKIIVQKAKAKIVCWDGAGVVNVTIDGDINNTIE